jgi:hypothetical protein
MNSRTKLVLGATMSLSLLFGFVHTIWPEAPAYCKRLHIFGFNLVTGGSLILYYTEGVGAFSPRVKAYFGLALLYALSATAGWYIPTLIVSVPLFLLVESVRIERFALLPIAFFRSTPVSEKFQQASLLCLSIGIAFASLVILNNEYLNLIEYENLTIEVFFLGYSFPVSLITMSIMFSFMTERKSRLTALLQELGFWIVNVGVIVFFAFIIFELGIAEIAAATTLFVGVWMIFFLFIATAPRVQQKTFLVSGMVFLLFTAITGILYILQYFYSFLDPYREYILVLHAMVSLYGWNLSGVFIIIRWNDFPIQLNSAAALALHWAVVLILAPLGKYSAVAAVLAMAAYVALLVVVFAGRTGQRQANR